MKIAIIDDSRLARAEIRRMVDDYPAVENCGEASNADEARTVISECEPDLLLLDIEMPGENGFELLASLQKVPDVIFTTAYDQFALKAFENNAVDYLVKPIDPERLEKALGRLVLKRENGREKAPDQIGVEDKVFVRDRGRCWFVTLKEVRFFETYGNYSWIYFNDEKALVSKSLNNLEERLDSDTFFRANRQFIINLNHIRTISPWNRESYRVEMSCGKKIDISRRRSQEFNEQLSL